MNYKEVFSKLMVASCNCQTKTPDPSFHECDCNYALLHELQKDYESLLDDRNWRLALEAGGVDNWDWFYNSLNNAGYFGDK